MRKVIALVWILLYAAVYEVMGQCSKQDYEHCVKLADPLLRDPHLIYPDNARDIEHVCRTWSYFADCVKKYTERCLTEAKREEFNKAVENPVGTIHKLCSMPEYRENYMKHAGCMKMTLTQDSLCGRHYRLLVSQVSGEAPTASVCCSHHLFRECVIDHTQNVCNPESAPFSTSMLDKALSFLKEQCANFIPNQLDCPGADFYKSTSSRSETRLADQEPTLANTPTTSFSSFSDTNQNIGSSWVTQVITSTRQSTTENKIPTMQSTFTSRPLDTDISRSPEASISPMPWTPSTRFEPSTDSGDVQRTSFARGITWTPGGPMDSDVVGSTSSSGDSTQTWRVTSSDVWLPASRPVMIDNAIDEPNQQGLESNASNIQITLLIKFISMCHIYIFFR